MKVYIAAGNYASNKEWALKVKLSLKGIFDQIDIIEYAHWKNNQELMDLGHEVNRLKARIGKEENYGIFAKSLGVVLVLKAIKEGGINPKFLVSLGTPVYWCKERNIDVGSYLFSLSCPLLIIQNDKDPVISSKELRTYLKDKGIINYNFVEYKNSTHDYDNLNEIRNSIKHFLKKICFVEM